MAERNYQKKRGYSLSPFDSVEKIRVIIPKNIKQIPEFNAFTSEIHSLNNFCEHVIGEIKKGETDNSKIQHMKNYIVIRTMSIMENKIKSILVNFVDKYNVLPSKILDLDTIPISLDQFDEYKKDDITKGKILASIFQMNKANIGKVFGKINNVSFYSWAQKIIFKDSQIEDNWLHNKLESYYTRRNNLVHNLQDISEDVKELKYDIRVMDVFVTKLYLMTVINLETKNKFDKEKREMCAKMCKDNLEISLSEFKEITTQYYSTN